jgi:1-acyl-sn-glycerol-3-phosphate acyltransferase
VGNARLRLASLWIAHVARVMADNCLRIYVALEFARLGEAQKQSAWHLVTLLLLLPAVFLAPLNGAICNSLPKTRVLTASALLPLAALLVPAFLRGPLAPSYLLLCWVLVALTSAVNGPVRYAFLPAAAQDTRWPLTRINGIFETGSAASIIAGLVVGASGQPVIEGISTLQLVNVLLGVSLAATVFVWFAGDVRRPESPLQAVAGFFADCRRIWHVKITRGCLLGLASLRGLMTGLMGALLAESAGDEGFMRRLLGIGVWVLGGVGAGSLLAGLQRHPRRVLGLVPWGATGLTVGLAALAADWVPGETLCALLGVMVGLVNVPLAATYQGNLPADARGNGMAVRNFADYLVTALVAGLLFALGRWLGWSASAQLWLLAGLAGVLAALSWRLLLGPVFEQLMEIIIWPIYRIKGYGPGLNTMPAQGALLVVANHTAWMDPVWTAKVLPRRLIGMLTSVFFDIPALRWVLTHLAETIRVQQTRFRREVPELQKAIDVLDRGDCVLIFPEGALRKKEEGLLKQFGQGVWHILIERPHVPVVICWIEGGWGSYFSYFQGPPTKNKRFDFWRRIRVAVSDPQVLPPEVLADQRTTRQYLMQRCLEARRYLGLDVPALDNTKGEEEPAQKTV